jgi:integrase
MARPGKPWLNRGRWVAKINGRLTILGADESAARAQFARLTGKPLPLTVADVCARYLAWTGTRGGDLSPATAETYRIHTTAVVKALGTVPVSELRGIDVLDWLASRADFSTSTRASYGRQLRRVLRWACGVGLIDRDPLERCPMPTIQPRARAITDDDARAVLAAIKQREFHDLVSFLWLTGCRPGEAFQLRGADVDISGHVVHLELHKTIRKTGKPRCIPLCEPASQILSRLIGTTPAGLPLFRNRDGKPWTRGAVSVRFRLLARKHGTPYVTAYSFRSLWATQASLAGVPQTVAAACLGNSPRVLSRHYDQTAGRLDALTAAARKVRA